MIISLTWLINLSIAFLQQVLVLARLDRRALRAQHRRLRGLTLRQQRTVRGRRRRLQLRLRARLHRQEVPAQDRLLLHRALPERRNLQ